MKNNLLTKEEIRKVVEMYGVDFIESEERYRNQYKWHVAHESFINSLVDIMRYDRSIGRYSLGLSVETMLEALGFSGQFIDKVYCEYGKSLNGWA